MGKNGVDESTERVGEGWITGEEELASETELGEFDEAWSGPLVSIVSVVVVWGERKKELGSIVRIFSKENQNK
jgi:hypothetical protein